MSSSSLDASPGLPGPPQLSAGATPNLSRSAGAVERPARSEARRVALDARPPAAQPGQLDVGLGQRVGEGDGGGGLRAGGALQRRARIRRRRGRQPGGERRVISVLFCDLVGFSSFSERLSPEALVALLNEYFEEVTKVLAAHRATFDKFIGDAVMCFWNAPLSQPDHAERACLAALDLIGVIERLAPRFEQALGAKLDCRIGI
ncbi:MAG: adenylate/guanylate cyclase domain-containing protein, partial [Actinobacteria bacterium]|nr:adenylate/guanylate cyclase domain-containing protein [Actinomycetota bacterium]